MSVGEPAVTATCELSHHRCEREHPATLLVTYECKLGHNRQTDIPLCNYHVVDLRAGRIFCLSDNKPLVVVSEKPA